MDALWAVCDHKAVCIAPVVLGHLPNLELLLAAVQAQYQQHGSDIERFCQSVVGPDLCQKVLDLHPRIDRPGNYGFPLWLCEREEIERLFFDREGAIYQLNVLRPPEMESDAAVDEFPPYACPDLVDSYLADLTHSLGSFSEARAVVFGRSITAIAHFSKRLGDLYKGKEERARVGLKKWFWDEWAPENQDLIDQSIFGED